MLERQAGRIIFRNLLSPRVGHFRLAPQAGSVFPDYVAGQHIYLTRSNCRLMKKQTTSDGGTSYIYLRDARGGFMRTSVTRPYSIASAPFETKKQRYLEFYVMLEPAETEASATLAESLFAPDPECHDMIEYANEMRGDFTLQRRSKGFAHVVLVGAGTGLAPFISMIRQLQDDCSRGKKMTTRYTLFHAHRTFEELGYHSELLAVEKAGLFDFVYVPSVSRPTGRDLLDQSIGKGRVSDLLRRILGLSMEENIQSPRQARDRGQNPLATHAGTEPFLPILPAQYPEGVLRARMDPSRTVILACGNPQLITDLRFIARATNIRLEVEGW